MAYRMSQATRVSWLRLFLKVLAVGFLAAFLPWITLILVKAPILASGGALAPLLRFQPYNASYEAMMAAVYVVWAALLWRASHDPARHPLFLDFTIWGSAAHGLVMLVATPVQKGLGMTLVEGLPLLGIAAVLWWLKPDDQPVPGPTPEGAAARGAA